MRKLPNEVRSEMIDGHYVYLSSYERNLSEGPKYPLDMKPYYRSNKERSTPLGWRIEHDFHGNPVNVRSTNSLGKFMFRRVFDDRLLAHASKFSQLESKAIGRFYSNLKGLDFNALVTVGESRETFKLIGDTAYRLANTVRALKRLDIKGAYRSLGLDLDRIGRNLIRQSNRKSIRNGKGNSVREFAHNSILEVQYGWKPLLYDIDGALQALAHKWEEEDHDFTVVGSACYSGDPILRDAGADEYYTWSGKRKQCISYTAKFQVLEPALRKYNALGLTNLGSVVWELIPFSFVSDWFIPIGTWIEAQTALSGVRFIDGCRSEVLELEGKATHMKDTWGYDAHCEEELGLYHFRRTVLDEPPEIHKILRLQAFGDVFNFNHARNGLALLSAVTYR